ncbi:MAG: c-type cytochrome, partial [Pseudomonadota bacterium]
MGDETGRAWLVGGVLAVLAGLAAVATETRAAEMPLRSGAEVWGAACAACHGPDGAGQPRAVVGFDIPLPDFRDCTFATSEPTADWFAVVHEGGPVRALDRMMPAFAGAL